MERIKMSDTKKYFDMVKEHDVKYVDFRFTDPRGKWQHTAQAVDTVDEGVDLGLRHLEGWQKLRAKQAVPDRPNAILSA